MVKIYYKLELSFSSFQNPERFSRKSLWINYYFLNKIMNRLLVFAFLVLLVLFVVWLLFFRTSKKHVPPAKEVKEPLLLDVVSCGCPDLATAHPERVKHKMNCSVFRSLNPGLTANQFLEYEGFPTKEKVEWPNLP
ncbi:hypothetical protein MEL_332 [Melbournevirus]|uniref:hypothetical protein n=1 Tax=Melbournevirus TaxID=1560514 RepID=UPI00051F53A9|nr:hypothetical protein MEL_332 [Melbournevirus]AIT54945.1 transmembrane domain-containing protein [Melbournevirus]